MELANRTLWGALSLELWFRSFIDASNLLKNLRHEDIKKHVIEFLKIYWPKKTQRYLDKLPQTKIKT